MKYFFLIAISLLLAQPALAARQVPGSVPSTTPLQPMPPEAGVNVKNNIQFKDESHQGQFDSNGNVIESSGQAAGSGSQAQSTSPQAPSPKSGSRTWLWVLVVIIAGGGAWWGLKAKKA